jgi:hypothetical protein
LVEGSLVEGAFVERARPELVEGAFVERARPEPVEGVFLELAFFGEVRPELVEGTFEALTLAFLDLEDVFFEESSFLTANFHIPRFLKSGIIIQKSI